MILYSMATLKAMAVKHARAKGMKVATVKQNNQDLFFLDVRSNGTFLVVNMTKGKVAWVQQDSIIL